MDFFERQDKARRKTKWLVLYFVLAVVGIIAAVYLAAILIVSGFKAEHLGLGGVVGWWHPKLFSSAAA